MRNGRITEIPDELMAEADLASKSLVTPAEVEMLFQGERRDVNSRGRERIWTDAMRAEYARQI